MTRHRWIAVAIVAVAIALIGSLSRVSPAQGDDDYQIINQITTLKQRQNFFVSLTSARKSALWRKHFAIALTQHPELTAAQRDVVNLALVIASPDLFTVGAPDVCSQGSVFSNAIETAFKDARALRVEIFGQPAQPLPRFAHTKDSRAGQQPPPCVCRIYSNCTTCFCDCKTGGVTCTADGSGGGCGCFWQYECNSLCASCLPN